ncbi:hypothetical protein NH340_JMT07183 [Sarcoptes scabiei]|nr:hypothetical protein NH340_JMT07183 [Sarcoptes scabiei]
MNNPRNKNKKKSSQNNTIPKQLILRLANDCKQPLHCLNGYDPDHNELVVDLDNRMRLKIRYYQWLQLSSEQQQWMINLTERNMRDLYEQSAWKWNRQSKMKEFKHPTAKHLIITSSNLDLENNDGNELVSEALEKPIAFVHFRFEQGYRPDETSLYCYELQVEPKYQNHNIGSYLMNQLEVLGSEFRLQKIHVTVLKKNISAFNFYTKKLSFKIDDSSPSCCDQDADYEILSLKLKSLKKSNPS